MKKNEKKNDDTDLKILEYQVQIEKLKKNEIKIKELESVINQYEKEIQQYKDRESI
jgi:hypothetical protein